MAKIKKYSTAQILAGKPVTLVARKKGQPEKHKDLIYEEALKSKRLFEAKGWAVQLYQIGYFQPFGKPIITKQNE